MLMAFDLHWLRYSAIVTDDHIYIGETGRKLNARLMEQKRATRNSDINNHIAEDGCSYKRIIESTGTLLTSISYGTNLTTSRKPTNFDLKHNRHKQYTARNWENDRSLFTNCTQVLQPITSQRNWPISFKNQRLTIIEKRAFYPSSDGLRPGFENVGLFAPDHIRQSTESVQAFYWIIDGAI